MAQNQQNKKSKRRKSRRKSRRRKCGSNRVRNRETGRCRLKKSKRKSPRRKSRRRRKSPRRKSPRRKSPRRKSPRRKSRKRRKSPRRKSPRRKSRKRRKSPRRKSPRRKSPRRKSRKRKGHRKSPRRKSRGGYSASRTRQAERSFPSSDAARSFSQVGASKDSSDGPPGYLIREGASKDSSGGQVMKGHSIGPAILKRCANDLEFLQSILHGYTINQKNVLFYDFMYYARDENYPYRIPTRPIPRLITTEVAKKIPNSNKLVFYDPRPSGIRRGWEKLRRIPELQKYVVLNMFEVMLMAAARPEGGEKIIEWLCTMGCRYKGPTEFLIEASKRLDKELYGMQKVKEQLLLFLSAKLTNPGAKRSNLGLLGAPGTGKTKIARMIAKLMDWGFEQISFGGVNKADFLKGHEYTYVGAQPGAIVKCLRRMGHKNGVIFLDELEKAAEHPDISAALLHLVDQSQNHEFRDNFLGDITIDLSHIWYIGSMNKIPKDAALANRWWIIKVPGYTIADKIEIVNRHLLPEALKSINKDCQSVIMKHNTCEYFINKVSDVKDKGVRNIQRAINDIISKIDFLVIHQDEEGKVPFPHLSFTIKKKLAYPLKLTSGIIDVLAESKELSNMLNSMYI